MQPFNQVDGLPSMWILTPNFNNNNLYMQWGELSVGVMDLLILGMSTIERKWYQVYEWIKLGSVSVISLRNTRIEL